MAERFLLNSLRKGASIVLPLLVLLCLPILVSAAPERQEGINQAGIVIVHNDGRVVTRCVNFTEPQISGLELFQRSGLSFTQAAGPLGTAICTVNGEGCPTSDCFCQCKSNPCNYWRYFHANSDGSWAYSGVGASAWTVTPGGIDAWVWGDGTQAPPAMTITDICTVGSVSPAPVATEQATVVPTITPAPTATPTPTETATPTILPEPEVAIKEVPTATPSPTETPLPTATYTSVPTETPSTTPAFTVVPVVQDNDEASVPSIANYIVFAVLILGAAIAGVILRRKQG